MDNTTQFSHMVKAAISIGWALKLKSKAINDVQNQIPHFSMIGVVYHIHLQIFHYLKKMPQKKYIVQVVFDKEGMYCNCFYKIDHL